MPRRKLVERFTNQNFTRLEAGGRVFRFTGIPDAVDHPDAILPREAVERATIEALEPVDALLEDRARLIEDGRFTEAGVQERLLEEAEKYSATRLREPGNLDQVSPWRASSYIARVESGLPKKRDRLQGPPTAESNVDAARDAEMRRHLKDMEPTERRRFLNEAAAQERDDVLRAALDGAPELSGLDPDHQEQLRERVIRDRNPDLVAEIEADEAALRHLERTLATAQEALAAIATATIPEAEEGAAA